MMKQAFVAMNKSVVHLHSSILLNRFIFKYQVSQAWNKAENRKVKTVNDVRSPCFYI